MKTTYKAISQTNLADFNMRCTEAIQAGFHPMGSISVTYSDPYIVYTQAFMYHERAKE